MTATYPPLPQADPASPGDRLGLTLFFAIALHAMVILGITFGTNPANPRKALPTLEITLVQKRSLETPEKADYLAQADMEGGGNVEQKVRPQSPISAPVPSESEGVMPTPQPHAQPEPLPPPPEPAPPEPVPAPQPPQPEPVAEPKPETAAPRQVVTSTRAERREASKKTEPAAKPEKKKQRPSARDLVSRSLEMARLSAEINESIQAYAQRPRHRFISARTRSYKYAAYMESWVKKVERIGNLNYPDEARRRNLSGGLILDVVLKPDGSIHSIEVLRSSGQPVLDDAARRIVELAAPFAKFPEDIAKETDLLHITRTWQFLRGNRLRGH